MTNVDMRPILTFWDSKQKMEGVRKSRTAKKRDDSYIFHRKFTQQSNIGSSEKEKFESDIFPKWVVCIYIFPCARMGKPSMYIVTWDKEWKKERERCKRKIESAKGVSVRFASLSRSFCRPSTKARQTMYEQPKRKKNRKREGVFQMGEKGGSRQRKLFWETVCCVMDNKASMTRNKTQISKINTR